MSSSRQCFAFYATGLTPSFSLAPFLIRPRPWPSRLSYRHRPFCRRPPFSRQKPFCRRPPFSRRKASSPPPASPLSWLAPLPLRPAQEQVQVPLPVRLVQEQAPLPLRPVQVQVQAPWPLQEQVRLVPVQVRAPLPLWPVEVQVPLPVRLEQMQVPVRLEQMQVQLVPLQSPSARERFLLPLAARPCCLRLPRPGLLPARRWSPERGHPVLNWVRRPMRGRGLHLRAPAPLPPDASALRPALRAGPRAPRSPRRAVQYGFFRHSTFGVSPRL